MIVVNGGDVHDQTVFAHPQSFFQRPLAESTLYLENEHIQYIHALCLARPGGRARPGGGALPGQAGRRRKDHARRRSPRTVNWPANFLDAVPQ